MSICKANEVLIVNGRKVGDLIGSVTSFQWNGTGLVDYIISDYTIFDAIKGLCVGDFIPWLSDHCHITYDIELSNAITPSTNQNTTEPSNLNYSPVRSSFKIIFINLQCYYFLLPYAGKYYLNGFKSKTFLSRMRLNE